MEQGNLYKLKKSKFDIKHVVNGLLMLLLVAAIYSGRHTLQTFFNSTVDIWKSYSNYFLTGLKITILLSIISVAVGTVLGTLLYFMRASSIKGLSLLSKGFVELIRGTPLLLQLTIAHFGIGSLVDYRALGIQTSRFAFVVGVIMVAINSGAYMSEVIRSGIQSIDKGQMEAGRSLGMSRALTMKEIIIPQAIKNILPALVNEFIAIIKETSIVSTIGVTDIMYQVNLVRGSSYKPMEPLIISGVLYFFMTYTLSKAVSLIERSLQKSD